MGVSESDIHWMQLALEQARAAAEAGEVPVGAVLVDTDNQLLATAHNRPISAHDPTAHAEIEVLRKAAQQRANYRLINTTLYVTLEPCVMCVGAMVHARVKRLVYAAREPKTGAVESACQLLDTTTFNHRIEVESGILADESASLLSEFFAMRRAQKRALKEEITND